MRCCQCHTENNEGHRFCFSCGAPLEASLSAPVLPNVGHAASEGERRQLSVMFCDLVDSTSLSMTFDPEELREIIRSFQDACVTVVERYDGYIAQHLGDGLLIYFGYPRAHEDDGARAVHAGLDIIEAIRALQPSPDLQLQVRLGIATGKVVVGDLVSAGANTDKVAVGQTPNLAARLQGLAAPNTVVISPHTHRLLGHRFECVDLGKHTLKGFAEPVRVRQVMNQCASQSRFEAVQGKAMLPLVGRHEEMALLKDLCQHTKDGRGQIVMLTGEAGIGKSRLTRALIENMCAQGFAVPIVLQCSPYHNQNALFPVIEWLQTEIFASIGTIDNAEKWSLIHAYLDTTTLDKAQAAPILATFLSVPLPVDHAPFNLTPERQKRLTIQCLISLFTQRNTSQLALLIVEDLHWADPSTLEFIGAWALKTTDSRTLTLLTCRPDFKPAWPVQDNFTTVSLGRLPDQYALELVNLAAGDGILSERVKRQLVNKTDNIPLYLEELTKDLVSMNEQNALNGISQNEGDLADDLIPASLQDSLMARLDRLGEAKTVAQVAAVLGRDFDRKTLEAVWTGSSNALHDGLDVLLNADLLHERAEHSKGLYRFKHALIRDVAYDSLLKRSCEKQHLHVAEVLEREFPGIAVSQPDVLAHHYTAGKGLDQAITYWLAAGELDLKKFAMQETVAHLNRGLALLDELPDTPERNLRELDFHIFLGRALTAWKGYAADDVKLSCSRLQELSGLVGNVPQIPVVLLQLFSYNAVRANHTTSLKLASQILKIAEQVNNEDLILEGHLMNGIADFHLGNFHQARHHFEKCLAIYDPGRHGSHAFQFGQDPAVIAYNWLIWIYWLFGDQNKALQAGEQALSLARSLNHPLTLAFALTFVGWHRMYCRDYPSAAAIANEIVQLCSDQNILIFLAHGRMMLAWSECDKDNMETGLPEVLAALDLFRLTGARHFLPYWEAHYAELHARVGDTENAEEVLEQAFEKMNQSDERWSEAELHRYRGMLLERQGVKPAEVEACYRRAIEVAQKQGAKAWELRATFNLAHYFKEQEQPAMVRQLVESLRGRIPLDIDMGSLAKAQSLLVSCA